MIEGKKILTERGYTRFSKSETKEIKTFAKRKKRSMSAIIRQLTLKGLEYEKSTMERVQQG